MTNRPSFAKGRQTHSDKLSEDLAYMLSVFLLDRRSDLKNFRCSVQDTIIEPALKLAHKMHLSVDRFTVQYTNLAKGNLGTRRRLPSESSPFECTKLSPLGNKKLIFPVQEGIITYLFDLSPALIYEEAQTVAFREPRVLKQGRILVTVAKEEPAPSTEARQREPCTLLGLLNEIVYPKSTSHAVRRTG
jgi:hypothetical protein